MIAAVGAVPSPFDCYLANRGLKTLHIRMREHEKNAMVVARHQENSPHVEKVFYPGMCFNVLCLLLIHIVCVFVCVCGMCACTYMYMCVYMCPLTLSYLCVCFHGLL